MRLNIQKYADGEVVIPVNLDTKSFDAQISKLEYDLEELEETYKLASKDVNFGEDKLIKMRNEIEKTKNKIIGLQKQQLALNQTTKEYGSGISNTITKFGKMGLAIFGIRSAYSLILQSANQLAQQNDDIANKINAIKGSLSNALAPVVEVLVNLVYKLLAYLNVITKTFLGIDLFKNTAKSAKSAVGSAKKLRKTLAGFDEMNILNDNTSGSSGLGTGVQSQLQLPDTSKFELSVQQFRESWNTILEIDRQEAKKLFLQSDSTWGHLKFGVFDTTQGMVFSFQGAFDTIKGLYTVLKGVATGDMDEIKEGGIQTATGIAEGFRGNIQTVMGLFEIAYGLGYGLGTKIKDFIVNKIITPINDKLGKIGLKIEDIINLPMALGRKTADFIISKIDTIKSKLQNNFKDGFWKGLANTFIDIMNKAIDKINNKLSISISSTMSKVLNAVGVKVNAGQYQLLTIPKIPRLAKGGIINMPGKGVPLGTQAIGGEAGPEWVQPLSDSQSLDMVAEAIGRRINIALTNITKLDNRQIAREQKIINAQNAFAANR